VMTVKETMAALDRISREASSGKKHVAVAVSEAFALGMAAATEVAKMTLEEVDALKADLESLA
jgi:hypothetical protein